MPRNYNIIYLIIIPFIVGVITFYFIRDRVIFSGIYTQIGYALGFLASGILILSSFKKSRLNYKKEVKRFDKNINIAVSLGSVILTCVFIFGIYGSFRPELFKILYPFLVTFCIPLSVFYFLKIIIFKKDVYQDKDQKKFARHVNTSINQRYDNIFNWRPFVIFETLGYLFVLAILVFNLLSTTHDRLLKNEVNNLILPILIVFILLSSLYFFGKLFKNFWLTSKGGNTIVAWVVCFYVLLIIFIALSE